MHLDSGATRSLWIDGTELPPTTPLTTSISTEVCVVGAGIAGLTIAYLLSREGAKVVVIDDGPLCGGETGRTTAHLANEIDDSYQEIESLHGRDGARPVGGDSSFIDKEFEAARRAGLNPERLLHAPLPELCRKRISTAILSAWMAICSIHISDWCLPSFSKPRQVPHPQISEWRHCRNS